MAETLVVRYFAAAADAAGVEEETLDGVSTIGALTALLTDRYGEPMAKVLRAGSFLVDGAATRDPDRVVGAVVDVLPPFAGG